MKGKHHAYTGERVSWRKRLRYWIPYQCRRIDTVRVWHDSYFRRADARRVRVVPQEAVSPWLAIGIAALAMSWLTLCAAIGLLTLSIPSP